MCPDGFPRATTLAYYEPVVVPAVMPSPTGGDGRGKIHTLAAIAPRFYMTDKRLVLTTASSQEEARKLANALVERRLAACVNILPKIDSIYRWKDKIEESQEFLLLIKTTRSAISPLREAIEELHSYDLPECIVLAVDDGSGAYLQWIDESIDVNDPKRSSRRAAKQKNPKRKSSEH
jgi:periplasmic divalent cation tolerance protein